jgi:hypothetical protein
MKNGRLRTGLSMEQLSTPRDIKPSMKGLEGSSRYEFIKKWREAARKIYKLRQKYPPIWRRGYWVTVSFDGSSCPPWWNDEYDYPAEPKVKKVLEELAKGVRGDLLGPPKTYQGPDLVDLEPLPDSVLEMLRTEYWK